MSRDQFGTASPPDYSNRVYGRSWQLLLGLILLLLPALCSGVTKQQFLQSLDMMRNGCMPKFKVTTDILDRIRFGDFDLEPSQDLMCYTKCVAHLAGTLTKKGELSIAKASAQMPIILPTDLVEPAKAALNSCKDVQNDYKDSCAKIFYLTKCLANYDRSKFLFP